MNKIYGFIQQDLNHFKDKITFIQTNTNYKQINLNLKLTIKQTHFISGIFKFLKKIAMIWYLLTQEM